VRRAEEDEEARAARVSNIASPSLTLKQREPIMLETDYNVSMLAALCRGRRRRLSAWGEVSVGFCSRTIVLLRQSKTTRSLELTYLDS